MSEIVANIQKSSIRLLNQLAQEVVGGPELMMQSDDVLMEFITQLNQNFDKLMGIEVTKEAAVVDFETLSLVQEEELEAMVALEGMVTAARNEHLNNFIAFNTRLDSLFPDRRIDESINPLDPEQIASAFQEAIQPANLDAAKSLSVFRSFNTHVLKKLDEILNQANAIMIEAGVLPDLDLEVSEETLTPLKARSIPREESDPVSSFGDVEAIPPGETVEAVPATESVEAVPAIETVETIPEAETVEPIVEAEEEEESFPLDEAIEASATEEEPAAVEAEPAEASFDSVEEEPFNAGDDNPELFSIVQNLMHGDSPDAGNQTGGSAPAGGAPAAAAGSGEQQYMIPASMIPAGMLANDGEPQESGSVMRAFQPQDGQKVEMVDQGQLMQILSNIQDKLSDIVPEKTAASTSDVQRLDINESLGQVLQAAATDDSISALDRQSSDIINLVTLLFEAIWQDPSVPIPIKELIGRTQITIIKVALADVDFFNDEDHAARALLNDFAEAGIGWQEVENLEEDSLYMKIQELVERILTEFEDDIGLFEALIEDFREFRENEVTTTSELEERILKADERKERIDDIRELVTQKIEERILGRELHPFIDEILHDLFHKFMVMLVLKEGPGGNAWKQAINTVDVLLWSVQPKEHDEDVSRLETVNPRLMSNLRKALRITGVDEDETEVLLAQLGRVQEESFEVAEAPSEPDDETAEIEIDDDLAGVLEEDEPTGEEEAPKFLAAGEFEKEVAADQAFEEALADSDDAEEEAEEPEEAAEPEEEAPLTDDHPAMLQVDRLDVGTWVEFAGQDENNTRCKLAARINAIDKFIFVNRQGVKVVEKTKMGLAREIRDGTVSVVSEGQLFSRALESVIGDLRESQHEQQTASAYQPESTESV